MEKEKVSKVVTVTVVERPARKLIFLRHITATDYFSACEEVGCEWEGYFKSIPGAFDTGAGGRLPKSLIRPETSGNAFTLPRSVPASRRKQIHICVYFPLEYLFQSVSFHTASAGSAPGLHSQYRKALFHHPGSGL